MYLEGKYLWSDGNNSTYTNWDQGEPYNDAGPYCAFQNFDNAKWRTGECFRDTLPYFCEIPQDSCLKNKS
uniref:C-type lectin domain-containing protein n=1 Tax=Acrobeloides nanus TaxID=290746 RepID=A0A914DYH0_9BILA